MSNRQFRAHFLGQFYEVLGLAGVQGEWFLNIDAAAVFKADFSNFEMAFRGSRDVNHVRTSFITPSLQICKVALDRKALLKFLGPHGLSIAHRDDLAVVDSLDLHRVGIGDLAASHDRDLKHSPDLVRRPRCTFAALLQWRLLVSSQDAFSICHCCKTFSSIQHANGYD